MQLASLKKEIHHLKISVQKRSHGQFTWERDEKNNLVLHFGKSETISLPCLQLRPYQQAIQHKLFTENYKRFFLVRPRRSGKEIESWNLLIQGALTQPGLYLMIYPTNVRARLVLWEGAVLINDNNEARSLRFLDMIPKRCIKHLNFQTNQEKQKNFNHASKCVYLHFFYNQSFKKNHFKESYAIIRYKYSLHIHKRLTIQEMYCLYLATYKKNIQQISCLINLLPLFTGDFFIFF